MCSSWDSGGSHPGNGRNRTFECMHFLRCFSFSLLLLLSCNSFLVAQEGLVVPSKRSLEDLKELPDDTTKALILNRVGWDTAYSNLTLGLEYARESYEVSRRLGYTRGLIMSLNTLGATYNDMGEYDEALDAHLEGLGYCETYGDPKRTGTCLMNISLVYSSMGDSVNARKYLERAVDIYERDNYEKGLSVAYINLGAQYLAAGMRSEAITSFEKSLALAQKLKLPVVEAHSWSSLALAHAEDGNNAKADECIQHALSMVDTLGDDYLTAQVVYNAAELYYTQEKYDAAEQSFRTSLALYREIGVREEVVDLYLAMCELYTLREQPDSALHYWKKHMLLKDSLLNEEVLDHQRNLEARYQSEKTQQEIELLTRKGSTRKWFLMAIAVCFLVLVFLVIMLYKRNQFRKNTNMDTAWQNALIEEKNRSITDSINYASRIQEAVIPSVEQLKNNFTDAFVFSRPKDIVSGDFWWCTEKNTENGRGEFFLAGADSTGHGVPGGFMSMLGSVFLFEIITENGVRSPAEILNQLRTKVIAALKRSGSGEGLKDGMDMVMCTFSPDRKTLQFACAMNPLWVIRGNSVIEYRPDKFPVGEYPGETRDFTLMEHHAEPGDMIYLFSDGYADQFGGTDGKKFKYKQLRDTLCSISRLACDEQLRLLNEKFMQWKGPHEQVDDVLIIGIRI